MFFSLGLMKAGRNFSLGGEKSEKWTETKAKKLAFNIWLGLADIMSKMNYTLLFLEESQKLVIMSYK